MNKKSAVWAAFAKLWRRLGEAEEMSMRASFSIEGNWSHGDDAWLLSAKQEPALGGASMEVAIVGLHTLVLRLPGDSSSAKCPWLVASYIALEWSDLNCATLICIVKGADGKEVPFRLSLFSGSRELELVELNPRYRLRLQELFSSIRWSLR